MTNKQGLFCETTADREKSCYLSLRYEWIQILEIDRLLIFQLS